MASTAVESDMLPDHDNQAGLPNLHGAPDIVFYYQLSPLPAFDYISGSVTRILGYTPVDHYENPMLWMEIVDETDREWFSTFWIQSREGRREVFRFIHREGGAARLEITLTPLKDEFGATRAIQGFARDVSTEAQTDCAAK